MNLADVDTFVIVLLENRSFDHLTGYLSLPSTPAPMPINGLRDDVGWQQDFANNHDGQSYRVYRLDPSLRIDDPPHELETIARQIDIPPLSGAPAKMGGFVTTYAQRHARSPSVVMGHLTAEEVPVHDFFARNFVICDHWYSSLPSGTQPNRLMAMSGASDIKDNVSTPIGFPNQQLVYDWLDDQGITWCTYACGLPFFSIMPRMWPTILWSLRFWQSHTRFRRFSKFNDQWISGDGIPQVIFIEPRYTDEPIIQDTEEMFGKILAYAPNDDHPPTGVAAGQQFLHEIYETLTRNPALWARTLMIVTYDEHGGFFDHVPPLPMWAAAGGHDFESTGVRVPAFIISPLVKSGAVHSASLDHTSILQMLSDRFRPDKTYSDAVSRRQQGSIETGDIWQATTEIRIPAVPESVREQLNRAVARAPRTILGALAANATETAQAFHETAVLLAIKFPSFLIGTGLDPVAQYVMDVAEIDRPRTSYFRRRVAPGAIRLNLLTNRAASLLRPRLKRRRGRQRQNQLQARILAARLSVPLA